MKLILKAFDLQLKHTFTISRKSIDIQPTLIVQLQSDGFDGFGEATSNPYYNISVPMMMHELEMLKPIIEQETTETPEQFWNKMNGYLSHNKFALCALDQAYTDLYARKKHKKTYELWNFDITKNPLTNYTIGIDSIDNMLLKMNQMPFPIYKIKLGTQNDLEIVKELRKHTNSIFRIDANCGWDVDETIKNAIAFKKLGVEFLEQPLKADDWLGHAAVFKHSVLPVIADESCIVEDDIAKCNHNFHGVNIKLMKCGGITPAMRMITNSKKLGLKTMVGCMTESSVGIAAIAQLLPHLDFVDMDGALLLKQDIATGVTINYGKITYAQGDGNGVSMLNN